MGDIPNAAIPEVVITRADPGQPRWAIVDFQYYPPGDADGQAKGDVNCYILVKDEAGKPLTGVRVLQKNGGETILVTRTDPNDPRKVGEIDFIMTGASAFTPKSGRGGAYSVSIKDAPASDVISGLGLVKDDKGHVLHCAMVTTFQRQAAYVPPKPPSGTLRASASEIQANQSVTLTWSVGDAAAAQLNGQTVTLAGSQSFTPDHDTTYVLKAQSPAYPWVEVARVTVKVAQPPPPPSEVPAATFTADPDVLPAGGGFTRLAWSCTGAPERVTLDGNDVRGEDFCDVELKAQHNFLLTLFKTGFDPVGYAVTVYVGEKPQPLEVFSTLYDQAMWAWLQKGFYFKVNGRWVHVKYEHQPTITWDEAPT